MNFNAFLLNSKAVLLEFATNRVFLCVVLAWFTAQFLKIFTSPKYRKEGVSFVRFVMGCGGMPSSHAAAVSAACFSCGILYGFNSGYFAVSAVLAAVVMRDAAGIRREAGKQAEAINAVTSELSKKRKFFAEYTLSELLGHTPLQVICGALLGLVLAILCQCLFFVNIPIV